MWGQQPRSGDRMQPTAQAVGQPRTRNQPWRGERNFSIVDVGTGSGAIALALAKELPQAEIDAVDISPAALEIARANAARHQLESRIHFHEGNLLEGFAPETFDFIVSNPPYVGESEEDTVQLEVRKFEPRNAVFAGPRGTEVIERLIPQAKATLKPGGWLIMEISGTIAGEVQKLLAGWEDVLAKAGPAIDSARSHRAQTAVIGAGTNLRPKTKIYQRESVQIRG